MLKADELVAIKAKVKQEMLRRNGYGSIASLGSSTYDFIVQPKTGPDQIILTEHGKKVIDPLLAIADYKDLILVNKDDIIPEGFDVGLSAYVDKLASESMTGDVSSCRGACTGLCKGTCISGCSGCTSCTGCAGSCTGQCDVNCSSCIGCSTGCQNGCMGCTFTCGFSCAVGTMSPT